MHSTVCTSLICLVVLARTALKYSDFSSVSQIHEFYCRYQSNDLVKKKKYTNNNNNNNNTRLL